MPQLSRTASGPSHSFKPPTRVSSASINTATIRNSASNSTKNPVADENEDSSDYGESIDIESDVDPQLATTASKSRQSITKPSTPRRRSIAVAVGVEQDPLAILEDDSDIPMIPKALVTRIIFEGFEDRNMKIGKEAMSVVEMYTRIFVQEAVARSKQATRDKSDRADGEWLQVSDLEKIAPQLILDF